MTGNGPCSCWWLLVYEPNRRFGFGSFLRKLRVVAASNIVVYYQRSCVDTGDGRHGTSLAQAGGSWSEVGGGSCGARSGSRVSGTMGGDSRGVLSPAPLSLRSKCCYGQDVVCRLAITGT